MKTIAYIDGGNLYHGLLRGHPANKWLDVVALVHAMLVYSQLDANNELAAVKYFVSRTKTYPHDPASVERQNIYLQAIIAHGGADVIEGYYNKNKAWIPSVDPRCQNCTASANGFVHVIKIEEKRTDVNLATSFLRDAYTNAADAFVIVSGDADFIAPLDLVRHELKRRTIVFNPRQRPTDLRFHATYCRNIPRDLPAKCQLPDIIPIGTHGRTIHRPAAWATSPAAQ